MQYLTLLHDDAGAVEGMTALVGVVAGSPDVDDTTCRDIVRLLLSYGANPQRDFRYVGYLRERPQRPLTRALEAEGRIVPVWEMHVLERHAYKQEVPGKGLRGYLASPQRAHNFCVLGIHRGRSGRRGSHRIDPEWCQEMRLGPPIPHIARARMTLVT